ncbi:uncharacterized protein LOC128668030 [Microplitis demolitor]|uniref:uncharacterized protein LOC128668030 n=1 Tax=Microplitis demolitor TaxID=69319 RepID=UPI00235B5E13|nr:uncharacterized protein LOC128668030 [Microplitis demolitor]
MKLSRELNKQFIITDLGELKCYLGINVRRNKAGDFLVSQRKYINKIIENARLTEAKGSNMPMDPGYMKMRDMTPNIFNTTYQKLIGSLLYLSVNTKPDITAPVAILSQHIKDTKQQDWNEIQRIIRYLKNTSEYELLLSDSTATDKQLLGYADVNWAESRTDRKSNSRYLFKFMGGTISWSCKEQD